MKKVRYKNVRQGDRISPELLTARSQEIFKEHLEERGIESSIQMHK